MTRKAINYSMLSQAFLTHLSILVLCFLFNVCHLYLNLLMTALPQWMPDSLEAIMDKERQACHKLEKIEAS